MDMFILLIFVSSFLSILARTISHHGMGWRKVKVKERVVLRWERMDVKGDKIIDYRA